MYFKVKYVLATSKLSSGDIQVRLLRLCTQLHQGLRIFKIEPSTQRFIETSWSFSDHSTAPKHREGW